MSISRREQIMQAIVATLDSALRIPVHRAPEIPIDTADAIVCVVDWESEGVEVLTWQADDCQLIVRMTIMARATNDWWLRADEVLIAAHSALMSDQTLGGRTMAIRRRSASARTDDYEQTVCTILHSYEIQYRHNSNDLTM